MDHSKNQSHPPEVRTSVKALLDDPSVGEMVRLVAGAVSLDRVVGHPRIQKSGLAWVGHHHGIVAERVQILGETEVAYLESLDESTLEERCREFFGLRLSLLVVTRGVEPPDALLAEARRSDTPVVVAEPRSSQVIATIHDVLDRLLAPSETCLLYTSPSPRD